MRANLYKGKRKDNGEWIAGSLLSEPGENRAHILPNTEVYVVDPETVGQYIGAVDKNGVMIFEGDLVEMKLLAPFNILYEVAEVRYGYSNGVMGFYLSNGRDLISGELTVVGNIHDNPEILGRRRRRAK